MGSWSTSDFSNWGIGSKQLNKDIASFGLRNVLVNENRNLTSPEKELLLWRRKLGISMHHSQRLMKVANVVEPSSRKSVKEKLIIPKYNSAATCDIQKCGSCDQAKASSVSQSKLRQRQLTGLPLLANISARLAASRSYRFLTVTYLK